MKIKYPLPKTLEKYGLTKKDYKAILERQGYKCPICGNPLTKRVNIDHFHQKNWKNLPPQERKMFCRGAVCFFCNKYYLGRSINIEKAKNVVRYLEDFDFRLHMDLLTQQAKEWEDD